jgi:hypothetical protein
MNHAVQARAWITPFLQIFCIVLVCFASSIRGATLCRTAPPRSLIENAVSKKKERAL